MITILTGLPFHLVTIFGTKKVALLMSCLLSLALIFVHLIIAWIVFLLGKNYTLLSLISALITLQILMVLAVSAILQTRTDEERILHSVQLVSRRQSCIDLVQL